MTTPVFYTQAELDKVVSDLCYAHGVYSYHVFDDSRGISYRAELNGVCPILFPDGTVSAYYDPKNLRLQLWDTTPITVTNTVSGTIQGQAPQAAPLPTFYTQAVLDYTNLTLYRWLKAATHGDTTSFRDDTGEKFYLQHEGRLPVSVCSWTGVDVCNFVFGQLRDSSGNSLTITPRLTPTSGAATWVSTPSWSYDSNGAYDEPIALGCDHVWVDVGFFSGKQACKKCDVDRH